MRRPPVSRFAPLLVAPGVLLWVGLTAAEVQFGSHYTPYPLLTNATGVAAGDVNGDGVRDVVLGHVGGDVVSLLLGQAGGGLQTEQTFTMGLNPQSVAVGDLDADGRADVVCANLDDGTVSVRLVKSNGSLGLPSTYSSPGAWFLALGDVTGDGRLDVVTANTSRHSVSVLAGTATGALLPAVEYPLGAGVPWAIAVGDLDRNGRWDVVTADGEANTITVMMSLPGGLGPGVPRAAGSYPQSVAIADATGDGWVDIVEAGVGEVGVFRVGPGGELAPRVAYPAGVDYPAGVAVADVNRDLRPDVIVTGYAAYAGQSTDHQVVVRLGQADGSLGPPAGFPTEGYPGNLAVVDLDGAGGLDIVVTHGNSGSQLSLLHGRSDGTFGLADDYLRTPFGVPDVAGGDFNGDGRPDVVVAVNRASLSGNAQIVVLIATAQGRLDSVAAYPETHYPIVLATGDLNEDGRDDVIESTETTLIVRLALPGGALSSATVYPLLPTTYGVVAVADLNGDGHRDVMTAQGTTRGLFLGNGTGALSARIDQAGDLYTWTLADLNGDGRRDLIGFTSAAELVRYLGNGDGTFGSRAVVEAVSNGLLVTVGRVDDDAAVDLVVTSGSDLLLSVYPGNGNGTFGARQDQATPLPPYRVGIGDVNGDGHADLVHDGGYNSVGVLLGHGDRTFEGETAYGGVGGTLLLDLRGDGFPDVVGRGHGTRGVTVLPNAHGSRLAAAPSPRHASGVSGLAVHPNPAAASIGLEFETSRELRVTLGVYDAQGRRVRQILEGNLTAGRHTTRWDGRDPTGLRVRPGVYYALLVAGTEREARRIVVLH